MALQRTDFLETTGELAADGGAGLRSFSIPQGKSYTDLKSSLKKRIGLPKRALKKG